jgi:hypothetical protein
LIAKPVPPDVMIKLIPSSQDFRTAAWIAGIESGMMVVDAMVQFEEPREEKTPERAGMHLSVDGSCEAVSEIMRMEAVSLDCGDAMVA